MENEAATKASFRIAQIIAKARKYFTGGILIKSGVIRRFEELCPENTVSLSAKTVTRRLRNLSGFP